MPLSMMPSHDLVLFSWFQLLWCTYSTMDYWLTHITFNSTHCTSILPTHIYKWCRNLFGLINFLFFLAIFCREKYTPNITRFCVIWEKRKQHSNLMILNILNHKIYVFGWKSVCVNLICLALLTAKVI